MAVCSQKGREMHAGSRVGGGEERKEESMFREGHRAEQGTPPDPHHYQLTPSSPGQDLTKTSSDIRISCSFRPHSA